uniref:NADH-ubiquinone oxidoreductase chain 2 n=1 Tax=Bovicola ovis TaxID=186214 RepID=A0A386B288_9NEOP|nr:NADH dehydrogenase subunit 2 [Bovicola ovis]
MVWGVMYLITVVLSTLVVLGGGSWITFWWVMEFSGFVFLCWVYFGLSSTFDSADSVIWTYYVVQVLSGLFLFLGLGGILESSPFQTMAQDWMILVGLLIKMGVPPFHGWLVRLSDSLTWGKFFGLVVIQKIPPMFLVVSLFSSHFSSKETLILGVWFCSLAGVMSIGQSSFRRFLVFSSIVNLGWMLLSSAVCSEMTTVLFVVLYSLMMGLVCWEMDKGHGSFSSYQLNFPCGHPKPLSPAVSLVVATMIGLPPLPIFLLKILIVLFAVKESLLPVVAMILISTSILTIGYFRLITTWVVGLSPEGWALGKVASLWFSLASLAASSVGVWAWLM